MTNINVDIPYQLWKAIDAQNHHDDIYTEDLIVAILTQWAQSTYTARIKVTGEPLQVQHPTIPAEEQMQP